MTTSYERWHLKHYSFPREDRKVKGFDEYLAGIEMSAAKDLEEEGLPTEPGQYCLDGQEERSLALSELVEALGYEDESGILDTTEHLETINEIRQALAAGDIDLALLWSVEFGMQLQHDMRSTTRSSCSEEKRMSMVRRRPRRLGGRGQSDSRKGTDYANFLRSSAQSIAVMMRHTPHYPSRRAKQSGPSGA